MARFRHPACCFSRAATAIAVALTFVSLPWDARGEEIALADGSFVTAAYVGEADGEITILESGGSTRVLKKADVLGIQWTRIADPELRRLGAAARERFREKREKDARALFREYTRAKEQDRAAIAARLDGFADMDLIAPLMEAATSEHRALAALALGRLETMTAPEAAVPLAMTALQTKDTEIAARAHRLAAEKERTLALAIYEYAATLPIDTTARARAIDHIGELGGPDSAAALMVTLYSLGVEAGLERADLLAPRRKDLTLGNTRLPIELPVVRHLQVATTARYLLTDIDVLRRGTIRALSNVTGRTFGDDPLAWQRWWRDEGSKESCDGHNKKPGTEQSSPKPAPGETK